MRLLKVIAPLVFATALAACSSASPTSRAPADSPAVAAAPAAALKSKPVPSGCALALVTLPDPGLATQQQAGYEATALEAASRKATGQVAVLAGAAAVDAGFVRMDLLEERPDHADLSTWDRDTDRLRSYCNG